MRNRSVAGPLILIVIGGLFLWNNLRPDVPLWELISQYWPFFLIAWGVLQLIEIGVAASSSRPLPRGIGGGGVVLVIFICLIGSGMYFVHHRGAGWHFGPGRLEMFGEQYDYPVSQQAPAGNARRIVFQNVRGNLRITGGDAPEIRISGRKTIRAFRKTEADQADRETPIDITTEGDHIVVRGNQDRVSGDRRVSSDLEVAVPRGFA